MDFYVFNVVIFVTLNIALSYRQWKQQDGRVNKSKNLADGEEAESTFATRFAIRNFKKRFLPVYLLISGADWLQGPYIYTMYKDEKGLEEKTVAHLFMTGFLAAAISATFVGALADRYGRRFACLCFCITYSVSCLTILFDHIIILFLGRILGGISSTLMYSVFESWMVTEYHRQNLDEAGGSLDDIFGTMITLNSVVAIIAGLFAQGMSDLTGTQEVPFMAAVICLCLAFVFISGQWEENYGEIVNNESLPSNGVQLHKNSFQLVKDDKRLWALAITSCVFEGSMYLWIFFKFPALRLAHQLGGNGSDLPFGMIFAALMCAMMLGSLFFTWYSALPPGRFVVSPSTLVTFSLIVAAGCFLIPILTRDEAITFWCFCVFEVCCGVYYPTMGNLKEKIVGDGIRAKIYGVLRVPLNIVVVVGLGLTKDGERHRDHVFMICSGALITAAAAVGTLLCE